MGSPLAYFKGIKNTVWLGIRFAASAVAGSFPLVFSTIGSTVEAPLRLSSARAGGVGSSPRSILKVPSKDPAKLRSVGVGICLVAGLKIGQVFPSMEESLYFGSGLAFLVSLPLSKQPVNPREEATARLIRVFLNMGGTFSCCCFVISGLDGTGRPLNSVLLPVLLVCLVV